MKFLYLFTKKIKYCSSTEDRGDPENFARGPWQEIWHILNYKFIAYLALAIARYIWPLLFIYHLTLVVMPGSTVDVQPADTLTLALLALVGSVGAVFTLRLDQQISLKLCNKYEFLLARKTNYDLACIERLSSRDLSVVIDGIGETVNLLAIPLFLISSTYFLLSSYGAEGLYCAAMIFAFLPISLFLSKIASKNYNTIAILASTRIELGSSWIRVGPVLKQFGVTKDFADLAEKAKVELRSRNIDTALRGADSYIIGFGRLLPYVFLSIVGGSAYKMDWDGSIFWLAMPLLSAVLALPRAFISYKNVERSLGELARAHSESSSTQTADYTDYPTPNEHFYFDPNWPIWPGELAGLLPTPETMDVKCTSELMRSLRLVPEFGSSVEIALKKNIEMDGSNISEGQKLRLQLLRGYFAAEKLGCKMIVDNHFSCLDAPVAQATTRALIDTGTVEFTHEALHTIATRQPHPQRFYDTYTTAEVASKKIKSRSSLLTDKAFLVGIALLLIPAVMMGYSANLTLGHFSQYELLAYILAGIALGILAGLYIESRTRSHFSSLIFKGLENVQEGEASNVMQIISRDTDVAYERLAWYSHDIAWITALLIFNFFALSSVLGIYGLLLAFGFSSMLYALYQLSIRELYSTRIASISGFDALIKAAQTTYVMSNAYASLIGRAMNDIGKIHSKSAFRGMTDFYETRTRAQIAKSVMSVFCVAISDFSIVLVVFLCMTFEVASAGFLFVVTSLLLVRSDLANVFLAITGYKSQSISKERIVTFSQEHDAVPVTSDGFIVTVPSFIGLRSYKSLMLEAGGMYTLVSPSGGGKTQYMKSIAGVTRAVPIEPRSIDTGGQRIRCYYLNRATLKHFSDKGARACDAIARASTIRNIAFAEQALVFFDEITSDLSVHDAHIFLENLQDFVSVKRLTLLMVDHRLNLRRPIFLDEITAKDNDRQSLTRADEQLHAHVSPTSICQPTKSPSRRCN